MSIESCIEPQNNYYFAFNSRFHSQRSTAKNIIVEGLHVRVDYLRSAKTNVMFKYHHKVCEQTLSQKKKTNFL